MNPAKILPKIMMFLVLLYCFLSLLASIGPAKAEVTLPAGGTPLRPDYGAFNPPEVEPGTVVSTPKVEKGEEFPGFPAYVNEVYNTVSYVIFILAVIMFVYGGYRYMTSGGEPKALGEAKEIILGAVTGVVIVLLTRLFFTTIGGEGVITMPAPEGL